MDYLCGETEESNNAKVLSLISGRGTLCNKKVEF